MQTVLMSIHIYMYLGNSKEYTQVYIQYPYTAMLPDSYTPLMNYKLTYVHAWELCITVKMLIC